MGTGIKNLWITSALALALLLAPARARADVPLTVPEGQLASALECSADLSAAPRAPVLLIPGTTLNPDVEFSWSWMPALDRLRWPYCTLALPADGMGDIQVAGEYVVYAIRAMNRRAGRRIQVVGHSQGGMVPRWALRFWPDTRGMVDNLVGLSPSNHGTVDAHAVCGIPGGCAASFWQQRTGSRFLQALNSPHETFPGISYSNIYTRTDEVVVPNFGPAASSALSGGGGDIINVAIQQVCPLDVAEHLAIGTYDNTAYRLAVDALAHPGPAAPSRIARSACLEPFMPGVDRATFVRDYGNELAHIAGVMASSTRVPAEPPLACYARDAC